MNRLIVIWFLLLLIGCTNENTVDDNEEEIKEDEIDEGLNDRQLDLLIKPQFSNVAVFLYTIRNEIEPFIYYPDIDEVRYLEFVIKTKKHAKHFAVLETNSELVRLLDDLAVKAESLQMERKLDKRKAGLKELNKLLGKLIGLTDENGKFVDSRNMRIYKFEDLVTWLNSIKTTIRDEEFEYIDRNYEIFLAHSIPLYVDAYA